MTEWIDFFVYAAMIVTYWFVFATWSSRFTVRWWRTETRSGWPFTRSSRIN